MGYKERSRAEDALQYKDKYISGMTDKFRAPLNKIYEYVKTINDGGNVAESVDLIRVEANNISDVISNINLYTDIVSSRDKEEDKTDTKPERKHKDLTDRGQHFFPFTYYHNACGNNGDYDLPMLTSVHKKRKLKNA